MKIAKLLLAINSQSKNRMERAYYAVNQHIQHQINLFSTYPLDSNLPVVLNPDKKILVGNFKNDYEELLNLEKEEKLNNLKGIAEYFKITYFQIFNKYGIDASINVSQELVQENDNVMQDIPKDDREDNNFNIVKMDKKHSFFKNVADDISKKTNLLNVLSEIVADYLDETFSVTQKENSIYYELNNPGELKAIEISDDLYSVKFYFSTVMKEEKDSYEKTEEIHRIRGVVSSAVYPPLPEFGVVSSCGENIEISGMKAYSVMADCNSNHIKEKVSISEQLHPLEWILTKARNSGILPVELYERIRIDVRHRVSQLHEIANTNKNTFQQMLNEVSQTFFETISPATIPPFRPFENGIVDWNPESENKDKSNPPSPSKVYLIKGGDEKAREEEAYSLARQDGFAMYGVYHNKDKSEYAVVFSCNHDTFNLMNFNVAKELAGDEELPDNFTTSIFGSGARFGVINISDVPKFSFRF